MTWLLIVCAGCSAAVAAGLTALFAAETLRLRRRSGYDRVLQRRYLRIVMLALATDEPAPPHFPLLRRAGSRLLLAETLAGIVSMTYGLPTGALRRIAAHCRLDEWLLRRARHAQGYRRARYLALLSALPVSAGIPARVARYGRSRNRYVRFYALMIQLSAEPSAALRRLSECAWPLSETEVAEIMALLRRGMLPIAYRPFVTAASPNVRRVGLSIVRQFGIEEAEPLLLELLAGEAAADALRTLCALRCPLTRCEVSRLVARMTPGERRALMRYMARSGYSPERLRRLFDEEECAYYDSIVRSYKRCLA